VIRYVAATPERIAADVDSHDAGWAARAAQRTNDLLAARKYIKATSIWGDIKLVFMRLQHFKCIFCERPLGQAEAGSVEQDVEHFRPKSSVKRWSPPAASQPALPIATGGAWSVGYYWLAYDLANYAASCKPCNSARKSNYFPIAGTRGSAPQTVEQLNRSERPLLIFPFYDEPEELITFRGVLALPRHRRGAKYHRALVTIELLNLNGRGELIDDRFRTIRQIMTAVRLSQTSSDDTERDEAIETLQDLISDDAPQAACARAFMKLIGDDPRAAWTIYLEAKESVRARRQT
jgi:hypothetical protein